MSEHPSGVVASGSRADDLIDIKPRKEDHRSTGNQGDIRSHEKPVGMKDCRTWEKYIVCIETPGLCED